RARICSDSCPVAPPVPESGERVRAKSTVRRRSQVACCSLSAMLAFEGKALMTEPPSGGYPPPPPPEGYPPPPPAGQGGYPPPPAYGSAQPTGKTNGMAIGSLVASLFGLVCGIGSIIGIVALNQVKQSGEGGKGMAQAGIIVGAISLVISIAWNAYVFSH